MCTVTIVPLPGGDPGAFRFACNRDELRSRLPARPPEERSFGRRTALHPVDGDAGGTWVGANDAGLVMSLLNLNPAPEDGPPVAVGSLSRGAIIPALLHHERVRTAVTEVLRLDPAAQRPFRLVLADRSERAVVRSDGRTMAVQSRDSGHGAFMITSSGLGDHLVERPRRRLFEQMFSRPHGDLVAVQDAFHRSHWPDRGHLSVSMDRPEALTLSHTVVTVTEHRVEMTYVAGPPHLADPIEAADDTHAPAVTVRPLRLERRERTAG